MKLSAPPPPPPEPSEPGATPAPNNDGQVPDQGAGASEAPPQLPSEGRPTSATSPLVWPTWFAGVDAVLVILAVLLGFLVASFTARNSDLWLHLGVGKMFANGSYTLGIDPLSYSAADRPWVNHSWLFDLGAYLIYQKAGDNGFTLVLIKALVAAGALALLIGIHRPGQSLFPWAVLTAIAAIAIAPRLSLHPQVGSIFFLVVTLFLVFRMPTQPKSWRLPVAIGATFWLWSNIDAWFILGPVALGLLLVGEVLRTRVFGGADRSTGPEPLPNASTLGKTLLVGLVACMLNPHHVRIWQIPYELLGSAAGTQDPQFRVLQLSPLTQLYWTQDNLGHSPPGLAFLLLLAAGLYAVCLSGLIGRLLGKTADVDPVPLPEAFLWCGFTALSLLSDAAIPFLAVVTVPIAASRFAALGHQITLGTRADGRTRLILAVAGVGRVLVLFGLVGLELVAWIGGLHVMPPNPALVRRVRWGVDPDPGLVRVAEQLQTWRESGELPAETHGMITSVHLANYCAWYAPAEKVFINGRYNHHRPEIGEFTTIRRAVGLYRSEEQLDPEVPRKMMESHTGAYIVLASFIGDDIESQLVLQRMSVEYASAWKNCSLWYLNGRASVFGWRASMTASAPLFDRFAIDPVRLAFGPGVERLRPGKITPVPLPWDWADDFVRIPPGPSPLAAAEASEWGGYKQIVKAREGIKTNYTQLLVHELAPRLFGPPLVQLYAADFEGSQLPVPIKAQLAAPWPQPGARMAIPILALRAARRAIEENPDSPDGYYALAQALADPDLPLQDGDRSVGKITALNQCLSRMPQPAQFQTGVYTTSPTAVARQLAAMYLGDRLSSTQFMGARVDLDSDLIEMIEPDIVLRGRDQEGQLGVRRVPVPVNQIDLPLPPGIRRLPGLYLQPLDVARSTFELALRYAAVEYSTLEPEVRQREIKRLEDGLKQIDELMKRSTRQFQAAAERNTKLKEQYVLARQLGLIGDAIQMLKKADIPKEFGQEAAPRVVMQLIALELCLGRLEEATADIDEVRSVFEKQAGKINPQQLDRILGSLRHLEYLKLVLQGDYGAAGEELERLEGRGVGTPLQVPPQLDSPAAMKDAILKLGPLWPAARMLGATISPLEVTAWGWAGEIHSGIYSNVRAAISQHLEREALFFFRRGFLSLLEGDIDAAKNRFKNVHRVPPPGWGLQNVSHPQAEAYLKWIEAAQQPATRRE